MFVDVNGLLINTDCVQKIKRLWDRKKLEHSVDITFEDGRTQIFQIDAERILAQLGTIVPNSWDYVVAIADSDGGQFGPDYWTVPVIAFRIRDLWGIPEPITATGELGEIVNEWALVGADGRCYFGDGESAKTVTEWLKRLNSRGTE